MHFKVCKDSWDSHIYNLVTVETKSLPKNWVFSTNYIFEIIDLFYFILLIQFHYTRQTKFFLILKVSSSYHLCVECFLQLSFVSEVYTKSATAADFVYTSESNESCKNIRRKDDRINSLYLLKCCHSVSLIRNFAVLSHFF